VREEAYVQSYDGTKIWYSSVGSGDITLVPCNGVLCTTTFWKYYEEHFKDRCRVITWDYRAHGRSALPDDPDAMTIADYVRDLRAVLQDAGVKKAVLLGHSMGVQVLLEYCRFFPDQVQGLIPICGPFEKPFATLYESDKIDKLVLPMFDFWAWQGSLISLWMRPALRSRIAVPLAMRIGCNPDLCPRDLMIRYYDHIASLDFTYAFKALKLMQTHSARDILDKIEAPTLIFAGDNDKMTDLRFPKEMHELMPNSEFFLIENGEHTALIESPDLITRKIEVWLREQFNLGKQEATVGKIKAASAKKSRSSAKKAKTTRKKSTTTRKKTSVKKTVAKMSTVAPSKSQPEASPPVA
jgi:pimeloyl-ACP methyl ester carboxylesterase